MKKSFNLIIIFIFLLLIIGSFCGCKKESITQNNILFALEDETLILEDLEKDCSCYVYVDGEKRGSSFSVVNGKVGLPKFLFSLSSGKIVNLKLEFFNDQFDIFNTKEFTIDVVDRAISNVQEFNAWYSGYEKYYMNNEYVILTNNIILNGNVIDNWEMSGWLKTMFTGTFDGRGYYISNFASKFGFIPNVGKEGCIKNLALINMVTTGENGFLGQWLCGSMQDCYFQGKQTSEIGGPRFTGFYSRYYDDQNDNGMVKYVKNVVINVDRPFTGYGNDAFNDSEFMSRIPTGVTFSNVFMINNCYNGKLFYGERWEELSVKLFTSIEEMKSNVNELPLGFSSALWKINSNGILCFKSVK